MNESKPDLNKILFMHLVSMLAMSAIQQMGKLVDPNTGKAETNLEAAQATIDMLDMLEARTRGNLDAEETKLLKNTLMSLKMNYVESQGRTPDTGRQTTDTRPEKTEGKTDAGRQMPDDGPAKTDDGRRTTDTRPEKTEDKTDAGRQMPDDGPAKTDDGRRTTEDGKREEDKTPKYHKNYE